MSGPLAFVVHSRPAVLDRLTGILRQAGFRTGRAGSSDAAQQIMEAVTPEVALVEVALLEADGGALQSWRASAPERRAIPLVALANGGAISRRRALRLGLTNVVSEPWDDEELVLATRAALRTPAEMEPAGPVEPADGAGFGEDSSGGPPDAPPARADFVSARRRAEVEALFRDLDADGLEDDPQLYNLHRVLALLNLASSYAASVAEPQIVGERLERHRGRRIHQHPELMVFEVREAAAVTLRPGTDPAQLEREALEAATEAWISALFDDLESSFPGNFPDDLLPNLVASVEERSTGDGASWWSHGRR